PGAGHPTVRPPRPPRTHPLWTTCGPRVHPRWTRAAHGGHACGQPCGHSGNFRHIGTLTSTDVTHMLWTTRTFSTPSPPSVCSVPQAETLAGVTAAEDQGAGAKGPAPAREILRLAVPAFL